MGKTRRFIQTLITSGLATLLSFLISFLLTPYITKLLGAEAYGFVTLAKNFTSYAAILTVALNSYAARFIAVEYHTGNFNKANGYISSVFAGDFVLSLSLFGIAMVLIFFLEKILNITADIQDSVKVLFVFVFVHFVITTVGTPFASAAYIKNRLDLVGLFRTISYIVEIVVYIVLFSYAEPKVWYVGFALTLAASVVLCGNYYIFRKYTPELKIKRKNISRDLIKQLVGNGIWNSINSLGNILNSGLDLLVADLMLTGLAMGQVAITKTLSGIIGSFNQLISQPFQPLFLKYYSDKDNESLLRELKLSMKVSGLFSCLVFAGFYSIGKMFYKLWIPTEDVETIYTLTVMTFAYMFFEGPVFPLYYIYPLTVKNKVPCIITTVGGLLNVAGMYLLIKYTNLGVYAVVLTTLVIMTIISVITNPIYMTKCLKTKWYFFYPTFFRIILSCLIMTLLFSYTNQWYIINSWIDLIMAIICYTMIGTIIYALVTLSKEEQKRIVNLARNVIRKKKTQK